MLDSSKVQPTQRWRERMGQRPHQASEGPLTCRGQLGAPRTKLDRLQGGRRMSGKSISLYSHYHCTLMLSIAKRYSMLIHHHTSIADTRKHTVLRVGITQVDPPNRPNRLSWVPHQRSQDLLFAMAVMAHVSNHFQESPRLKHHQ
jgi:hypothetical protein